MIYLHDGTADRSVTTSGIAAYWLAESGLSTASDERARKILEKLEQLGNWAAGEIMGRRRHNQERAESGYHDVVPRLTGPQMLVRRYLRRNPGAAPEQVAAGIEMPPATVNEVVSELRLAGILQGGRSADGLFLTESELRRYEMLD
ncbi:hypothetical protein DTW90_21910 [Neorhizobium sp. P12A]|uniref:hypothetical protein n=1 Tax=Neorhizobium sp. P12A TaxID=2268027 RepID=UPI0011EC8593|nr:hypothetical protein [Neorhizobium sp. P12A]KAA0695638.1 hypothetical protein DTW90_21910 [Neorhizobium sp. P12A]